MEDPNFKKKYQKYKLKVKLWEKGFKKKNGRVPSKYDIRDASQEIRDSYKMYYKLKTSFLEDTLNDVLSEDGFDILEMSQTEESNVGCDLNESLCESINGGPQIPLDISAIIEQNEENKQEFSNLNQLPSSNSLMGNTIANDDYVVSNFEAEEELELNSKAWGKDVSRTPKAKTNDLKQPTESKTKSPAINLKANLFKSTSFSKRNPRKALSRNDSLITKNNSLPFDNSEKSAILPDLETILVQKAKEKQLAAAIAGNPMLAGDMKKDSIKTQVDEGWLTRNAIENGIKSKPSSSVTITKAPTSKSNHYGLSNLDVSKFKTLEEVKSEQNVSQLEENKKQQEQQVNDHNIDQSLSHLEEPKEILQSMMPPKETKVLFSKNDSDSVVSGSGDEEEALEYRHRAKRRRIISLPSTKSETIAEIIQVPNIPDIENKTEEKQSVYNFEDGKSGDPDYNADIEKNSRKRAVARRTKVPKDGVTPNEKTPSRKSVARKSKLPEPSTNYDFDDNNGESGDPDYNADSEKNSRKRVVGRRTKVSKDEVSPNEKTPRRKSVARKSKALEPSTNYDFDDNNGENGDSDYNADSEKNSRKRAVGRRTKVLKDGVSPNEKTSRRKSVAKKSKPAEPSTPVTKAKNAKTPASTRVSRSRSKKVEEIENTEEDTCEENPLNPEDLKMALTLENGDLTSVPRFKMSELEQADNVASQYIHTIASNFPTATTPQIPSMVDAKRLAARKKLEEKIASGKLNENFVTIDLQKKKYSRGKKSVNYSKYKKKVWKDKKRVAALCGPDMDMRGCDGETLKCFTCGQAGHFSRDCKVKGDTLLPLTAALKEDPSPFMTLEEAASLASAKSYAAHGNNIKRLPAAANKAIYSDLNKEDSSQSDSETKEKQSMGENSVEENCSDNEIGPEDIVMESDEEIDGLDIDALAKSAEDELSPIKKYVGHKIPLEFLEKAGLNKEDLNAASTRFSGVGSLYKLNPDGSVPDVTPEVIEALKLFGHISFRKGQDRAIMRILCGLSTLVTLSTGSGKSLCYQLPAYLYSKEKKSITLVVSPLVSLMEDQVTGVPHFLRAHCLHTNQTPQQKLNIMQRINDGEVDILLVSPEAIVAGERSTGFGSLLRQLPPIAFACIDEAHCVSQWSHNFRPSYLMVCKVLKKNLGVKTVLGLTATATLPTRTSIINHLGIPDGESGIISDIPLPDNLILSISKDENKDRALLSLLLSKRFDECQSIIIYCTRRDECERISGYLRTCMQDRKDPNADSKKKRKRINWHAEPYHAGMNASRRRTIQNAFMKNELRIVVATIAFGMGINKPDIRAVIHYNMPSNFESYVQEIGRAGRDGKISHCHLFLDSHGNDQQELRRHIYANSIDRHVIRKLLSRIFVPCSCDKNMKNEALQTSPQHSNQPSTSTQCINSSHFGNSDDNARLERICPGHEIGFSIEKTVELLDIPAENISTLLCYMELDNRWGINVLSAAYVMAKVISYGGAKYLKYAAKDCPPLAMAIAMEIKKNSFKEDANIIEFSVVDVAAAIGWNSGVVKYQLKNLEWTQVNGFSQRSPITVSFFDLGFRIKAPGDFTAEEIDDALDTLYDRSVKQEQTQLIQLQYVFQGLSSVAYNSYVPCSVENFSDERGEQLKAIIRDYFRNNYPKDLKLELEPSNVDDDYIINDINGLINIYPDNNFSGRNVARLFHGISSPNYPAVMWYRCKYWRAHVKIDFNRIVQLANTVIVRRRT